MRQIEYFYTVGIERKVPGGTVQELRDGLLYTNDKIDTVQDIYWKAIEQVIEELTRYGENQKEDITILSFNHWVNELDPRRLGDA